MGSPKAAAIERPSQDQRGEEMVRFLKIDRAAAVVLCAAACVTACFRADAGETQHWHTEWQAAADEAAATQKPILAVFTGTDWCPHCQLLEQHVLDTPQFREWADGRVVLLMVDMPKRAIPQPIREERSALCRRYGVSSFPNVVLIGPDGTKIAAQPGYNRQSPETWIAAVNRHLQATPDQTALVARADSPGSAASKTTLNEAVRQAEGSKRPVLVVVSRSSDQKGMIRAASLVNDPSFREFANDHFVVAHVSTNDTTPEGEAERSKPKLAEPVGSLLGGVPLPSDEVEVIVTYDGRTPMYSQSARQPTPRLISALRRFLGARGAITRR